jgi:hypothetical protein
MAAGIRKIGAPEQSSPSGRLSPNGDDYPRPEATSNRSRNQAPKLRRLLSPCRHLRTKTKVTYSVRNVASPTSNSTPNALSIDIPAVYKRFVDTGQPIPDIGQRPLLGACHLEAASSFVTLPTRSSRSHLAFRRRKAAIGQHQLRPVPSCCLHDRASALPDSSSFALMPGKWRSRKAGSDAACSPLAMQNHA